MGGKSSDPRQCMGESAMMKTHRCFGVVAATVLLHGLAACTGMRDLGPAFEGNKTNVEELSGNVSSLNREVRPLVVSAWDNEIESRRTAVLKELQLLSAPYKTQIDKLTGSQIDKDLADPEM